MMKRLIALLLLAPVVANATDYTCAPNAVCTLPPLTSGTMTVTADTSVIGGLGTAFWSASGPGYTASGGSGSVNRIGLEWPIPPGGGGFSSFDDSDTTAFVGLAINGVGWAYGFPQGRAGGAAWGLDVGVAGPITHAGTYLASFDVSANFNGSDSPSFNPNGVCSFDFPCSDWLFGGSGTGVIDVSDYPGQPDTFYITGGTFT